MRSLPLALPFLLVGWSVSAAQSEGTAKLTLDGVAYELDVQYCDLGEEQGPNGPTLLAHGEAPDGDEVTLIIDRTGNVQEITLERSGSDHWYVARKTRMGESWMEPDLSMGEPLVTITGRTLTASGTFVRSDTEAEIGEGTLEARCE